MPETRIKITASAAVIITGCDLQEVAAYEVYRVGNK